MKVLCDVCGVEGASVFCCADEAALCGACDRRIHSANKLAGKHQRLSLLHPSISSSSSPRLLPLCDICKEKRGILFCQQDRAILCRDCDLPIHSANSHAGQHSRFLLTGIRLSSAPVSNPSSSAAEVGSSSITGTIDVDGLPPPEEDAACSSGGSSMTDYLMKMLPGWRVDDFLFDDAAVFAGGGGDCFACEALPAMEAELGDLWSGGIALAGDQPVWVPTASCGVNDNATAVAREHLQPVLNSMEGNRHGWKEEVSLVPQFEYEHRYRSNK